MMQWLVPVAAAVIETSPAEGVVQPALPAPRAKVIAAGLLELAKLATLKSASPKVLAGRAERSNVRPEAFLAMLHCCEIGPPARQVAGGAWEASMWQWRLRVAAAVIETRPAEVVVQPALPLPRAKVIAAGLLELAKLATLKSASPKVLAGRVERSNVRPEAFLAMLNCCEIGPPAR